MGALPDLLEHLTFSVFGLGNRCYEQFNAAAKMVHKALVDLGATPLLKLHLATTTSVWSKTLKIGSRRFGGV